MACPSSIQPRDSYTPPSPVDVPRTCPKLMRFFVIVNIRSPTAGCESTRDSKHGREKGGRSERSRHEAPAHTGAILPVAG